MNRYLLAMHVIKAMCAAMMGIYNYDFWFEMGTLLLSVILAALIGLVLTKSFARFMYWYIAKIEESKLMS